jgi:leucyl/phenylalanyl-tRNA--protein transferase
MPVYLLPEEPIFPHPSEAEPDGLIAIGGDLSPARILNAYRSGIFPWFQDDDDIFWFSPDPRMVLFPGEIRISASLQRVLKCGKFRIRYDTSFSEVMKACAEVTREGQNGTWIDPDFIKAYTRLYKLGFAHSVEAYHDGILAGGLYGICIGKAFFGESMFHLVADASKVAFYHLVQKVKTWQFHFIDCQVETDLFKRLGARPIPRPEYLELLDEAIRVQAHKGSWTL